MEAKLLYKIKIYGRVQGVGFRWSAAREAGILGINGFIKNLPDGSVYIEAEGNRRQLDPFVEWCRRGPGLSEIELIEVNSFPPVNYNDFRIEH